MTDPYRHEANNTYRTTNTASPFGHGLANSPALGAVLDEARENTTQADRLSRPNRPAGAFYHLLNPTPDDNTHPNLSSGAELLDPGGQSAGVMGPGGPQRDDSMASEGQAAGSTTPWQLPHLSGSSGSGSGLLPSFSRAFNLYMRNPDLQLDAYSGDKEVGRTPNVSSTGFLSPSYLQGSVYLQKLEEAHRAKIQAEKERLAALGQPHSTEKTGGSGLSLGTAMGSGSARSRFALGHYNAHYRSGYNSVHSESPPPNPSSSPFPSKVPSTGSHRGVSFELVEKRPGNNGLGSYAEDKTLSPLPTRLNHEDKNDTLEVLDDGYEVKCTGHGHDRDHEAGAIRADHFVSTQCGVYYFEMTVLTRKRDETTIGIGFTSKHASLNRAPGWEPESWGYHGDDGCVYASQNQGKPYGPKFGAGDTIGCLINFRAGYVRFTKNGIDQGMAFRDKFKDHKGKMYPTVGLKKTGDHVMLNFGQLPFLFDIDGYVARQRKMVHDKIMDTDTTEMCAPHGEDEFVRKMVLQFLRHDGYIETARAFAQEAYNRKQALSHTGDAAFAVNIKDDEDAFKRQSIRSAIAQGDIDLALKYTNMYYPKVLKDNDQVYFSLRCRKFIEIVYKEAQRKKAIAEKKGGMKASQAGEDQEMTDSDAHDMYDDDEDEDEDDSDHDAEMGEEAGVSKLSRKAVQYGQELMKEFDGDIRQEVSRTLDEMFALIAYPNPLDVPEVKHLLHPKGRITVAEQLNSAILTSLGRSSRAAIENLYAQTSVLLDDMRQDGGDAAFVSLQGLIGELDDSMSL